jgi:hypothetical protein
MGLLMTGSATPEVEISQTGVGGNESGEVCLVLLPCLCL